MKTSRVIALAFVTLLASYTAWGADWEIIPSPSAATPSELRSVAAIADNDVWAVGVVFDKNFLKSRTLTEHWNGTSWSIVPSPNPSPTFSRLDAVAAVSANDVWAVGFSSVAPNPILIEHWDGTSWSVAANPITSMTISSLSALAIVSANDIWAVGTGRIADENATVTIHWDGAVWSLVPSPNVTPEVDNNLAGVTAVASNDVWAVGSQQSRAGGDPHTLTLHWNGARWNIVPSPNDGGSTVDNHLVAASAASTNDVWAVGFSGFGTLSLHWDGVAWSVVQTPFIGGTTSQNLASVLALDSNTVWTVGDFYKTFQNRSRTLTEFWNGSTWILIPSPNRGQSQNILFGIDATPTGTLWAVGGQFAPGGPVGTENTLIMRRTP